MGEIADEHMERFLDMVPTWPSRRKVPLALLFPCAAPTEFEDLDAKPTGEMKMLERDIEKKCSRWAERRGWWRRKFVSPARKSAPDDIFVMTIPECFFTRTVFVEFKATGKDASDLQKLEHKAMRKDGLEVYVVNDINQFKDLFTRIEEEIKAAVEENKLFLEKIHVLVVPAESNAAEQMRTGTLGETEDLRIHESNTGKNAGKGKKAKEPPADTSWLD